MSTINLKFSPVYILVNYTEPISLVDAAGVAFMNPFHFSKMFHKTTALTFKEFLTKPRIDRACELLETTNNHISDIAQSVDFNTESHFSCVFKEIHSVSPSQYRKLHSKLKQ